MTSLEEYITPTSKQDLKHQCYNQICDYSDAYIVVKKTIDLTGNNNIDRRTFSI